MTKQMVDAELAMHALLDCILENKPVDFDGLTVPWSIVDRIKQALDDGVIEGTLRIV